MATNSRTKAIESTATEDGITAAQLLGDGQSDDSGQAPDPQPVNLAAKTPAVDALMQWLDAMCQSNDPNSNAGLEAIIGQVLSSEDMASVFRQTLPQSAQDFLDVPMLWTGVRILPSEFEEGGGAPYYASLSVQVGNPVEHRVINTSSWRVLAQVMMTVENDAFPQVVMLIEAAKAKKGQSAPLMLVQVDADGKPIVGK